MKLESDYLAKKGNDNNFTQILNSVKEPIGNEAEGQEYLEKREQTRSFKPSLLHTWVQHGLPDGSWKISNNGLSKSMWMPQCGDKIVYNRWLHHLFINGHCSCLTEKQKELPSTIPLNKDGKEIKMQMAHDVVACNQISSSTKKTSQICITIGFWYCGMGKNRIPYPYFQQIARRVFNIRHEYFDLCNRCPVLAKSGRRNSLEAL